MPAKKQPKWKDKVYKADKNDLFSYWLSNGDTLLQSARDLKLHLGATKIMEDEFHSLYVIDSDGAKIRIVRCRTPEEIAEAKEKFPNDYPYIYKLGASVDLEYLGPPYVPRAEWQEVQKKQGKKFANTFGEMFGVQTMSIKGAYPWDVEAVLVRMATGRLTGTQLLWD